MIQDLVVKELLDIDKKMCDLLYKESQIMGLESITYDFCQQNWNRTAWHKIIADRVEELRKPHENLA